MNPAALTDFDAADVNGDGIIDIVDSLLVSQYYVGSVEIFPAEFPPPVNVAASNGVYFDKIIVTWDAVPGSGNYLIYRADGPNAGFIQVGATNMTQWEDNNVVREKGYSYKIKAWNGEFYSILSNYAQGFASSYQPQKIELTDGSYDAVTYSVYADENENIYSAGYYFEEKGNACYWVNDSRINLDDGLDSKANSIFVNNGIIYTSGELYTGSIHKPCYWRNTTKIDLEDDLGAGGSTSGIFVADSTVYVSGRLNTTEACYWKNGVKQTLMTNQHGADTAGIYVRGNDVYVTGTYEHYDDVNYTFETIPCYWKNGIKTDLPGGDEYPNSIYVTATGTVYISSLVCYWENGIRYDLEGGGYVQFCSQFLLKPYHRSHLLFDSQANY